MWVHHVACGAVRGLTGSQGAYWDSLALPKSLSTSTGEYDIPPACGASADPAYPSRTDVRRCKVFVLFVMLRGNAGAKRDPCASY